MSQTDEHQEPPYWGVDTALFEGTLGYFGGDPVPVRGKIHLQREHYWESDVNQEITPVALPRGTRTFVHMKPFVSVPKIILTLGLFPTPRPNGQIGEVLSSREQKQIEVEIGQAQAYAYPDGTLVLWECFLYSPFYESRHANTSDPNLAALWHGFEQFLVSSFPQAMQIVTPHHDPEFDNAAYEAFLGSCGYRQVAKAAYGKPVQR